MAEGKNTCTGNCMACAPFQRQYCAAQITLNNMRTLNALSDRLESIAESVRRLYDRVESIQNNEAFVFNPIEGDTDDKIAQEGDGAEE